MLVPIHLNTEDVNNEIAKLKLSNKEITSQSTSTGVTTTTIVMNADGMVESTTTNTILKSPLSSPMSKSVPSDDSPGSPRGDFKLRSYKLKKKGSKDLIFVCKSCGVVKPSVQELNGYHKRKHE